MADSTPEQDPEPGKPKGALGDLVKAESMVQLALILPAACLIGWFLGTLADKHFHTQWITIAGIVLGAIAGFTQIFRTASNFMKNS